MKNSLIKIVKWRYRCVIIILSIFYTLFIISCVSQLPAPGEKCKSLLVICTDLEISGTFRRFSYLKLAIKGVDKSIDIIPSDKYIIVSNLKPGTYTTKSITQLPRVEGGFSSHSSEKPKPQSYEQTFTLEPGKITFFPILFIYICKETTGGVHTGWNLDEVSPEIRVKRTLLLKKNKSFSSWEMQ
ncbi:MAG: hypothetical protein JXB88_26955 [Spirochaetales bacterium]|nr:hypothetical protein [Spirochaetales bacterium]